MHKIEDDVEEHAIAPTKYGMVQGVDNVVIEDPNPPQIIFHKVCDLHYNMERKMYTDQTGKFLFKSYIGMHAVHHSFIWNGLKCHFSGRYAGQDIRWNGDNIPSFSW